MKSDLESLISRCQYIDAHTHSDRYGSTESAAMISTVTEHRILTLGSSTDPASIRASFILHEQCPWILTSAGIHPWNAGQFGPEHLRHLEGFYERAHQISEIGMDGLWAPGDATLKRQEELLETQLYLAEKYCKPVTLHTKSAEDRVLHLLNKISLPSVLIHWFDGNDRQLYDFLDLGCFLTIPPAIITKPRAVELMMKIPPERLLPETDNPPAWPWLFNKPARADQIMSVTHRAAELLGWSCDELMCSFRKTMRSFLKLDSRLH